MSVEHLAVVLHHSQAKGTDKLVLLGIANHQGDGGSWPSVRTLSKYANVTARQVQKSLAKLQSMGEVRVHLQAGGGRDLDDTRRPNRYDVLVECPGHCDRTPAHRDTRPTSGDQGALWKNPLSSGTPPVLEDTPPLSSRTSPPLSSRTPEPSLEPTSNPHHLGAQVQDARVVPYPDDDPRPCQVCGQSEDRCQRQQRAWPVADRHQYTPKAVSGAQG